MQSRLFLFGTLIHGLVLVVIMTVSTSCGKCLTKGKALDWWMWQGCADVTATTTSSTSLTVTSLAVTAETTTDIAVSGTVQLKATATYSDSSTGVVTSSATWSSANTAVATVSASGLVTGVAGGIVTITGTYSGASGTISVKVTGAGPAVTVGAGQPVVAMKRPGANEMWILSTGTQVINIMNTTTYAVESTITLSGAKIGYYIQFSTDGATAYVATKTSNTIEVIDAATKTITTSVATGVTARQMATLPVSRNIVFGGGTTSLNKLTIATNSIATQFDDNSSSGAGKPAPLSAIGVGSCTTAVGKPFLTVTDTDASYGGNDKAYTYTNATLNLDPIMPRNKTGAVTSYLAGDVYSSPNCTRIFVTSGSGTAITQVFDNTMTDLGESVADSGGIAFLPDNKTAVFSMVTAGNYKTYDYATNATLTLGTTINFAPPANALAGVTSDNTLFLPVTGSSTVKIYQLQ